MRRRQGEQNWTTGPFVAVPHRNEQPLTFAPMDTLEFPDDLTCMFSDCGWSLENPEGNRADTGEHCTTRSVDCKRKIKKIINVHVHVSNPEEVIEASRTEIPGSRSSRPGFLGENYSNVLPP